MPELAISATTATYPMRSQLSVVRSVSQEAEERPTALWVGATPLSETFQSETFQVGVRRLHELARLPANWDSYGSPPVPRSSIESAGRILALAALESAPVPFIGPVAGGGVEFAWESQGRSLEITLTPAGPVEYFVTERDSEREGEIAASLEGSVRNLLRWFLGPTP